MTSEELKQYDVVITTYQVSNLPYLSGPPGLPDVDRLSRVSSPIRELRRAKGLARRKRNLAKLCLTCHGRCVIGLLRMKMPC